MKITFSLLLLVSFSLSCTIRVGLIPFTGNYFVFGDKEINEALALCPNEDNALIFELGPYHHVSIIPAHRSTALSTLFVNPLGRSNQQSLYHIIARTTSENTLSYPGDEVVKQMAKFDKLIYGKQYMQDNP